MPLCWLGLLASHPTSSESFILFIDQVQRALDRAGLGESLLNRILCMLNYLGLAQMLDASGIRIHEYLVELQILGFLLASGSAVSVFLVVLRLMLATWLAR